MARSDDGEGDENGGHDETEQGGSRFPLIAGGVAAVAIAAFVAVRMMGPSEPPAPKAEPAPVGTAAPRPAQTPAPKAEPPKPAESSRRSAPKAPTPVAEAPAVVAEAPPAPAADEGILTIDSDVSGAQVFIDRQYLGVTPLSGVPVKAGRHQLNMSAKGFDGVAETLEIQPGPREVLIRFKEVRLGLSLDVVHKHRIGSCQGRLVASPQGLRYDASNKDDVFMAPLGTLEVFEIDYKAKILRVKLAKGKRLDFTDPAGNADTLFVFHRDVDKARQRLAKGDPSPTQP